MSINDNICSGKYKNKIELPSYPFLGSSKYDLLKKPVGSLTEKEITEAMNLRNEFEQNKKKYNEASDRWRAEEAKLNALFFDDCAKEEGLVNHPKRNLVEGKAWEHGHASGYSDIWHWYQEFADVVK